MCTDWNAANAVLCKLKHRKHSGYSFPINWNSHRVMLPDRNEAQQDIQSVPTLPSAGSNLNRHNRATIWALAVTDTSYSHGATDLHSLNLLTQLIHGLCMEAWCFVGREMHYESRLQCAKWNCARNGKGRRKGPVKMLFHHTQLIIILLTLLIYLLNAKVANMYQWSYSFRQSVMELSWDEGWWGWFLRLVLNKTHTGSARTDADLERRDVGVWHEAVHILDLGQVLLGHVHKFRRAHLIGQPRESLV